MTRRPGICLLVFGVVSALALMACVDDLIRKNYYAGTVLAHLPSQPIQPIVKTLERTLDLEEQRTVIGAVPNCNYYRDKIIATGVGISISLCHGLNKNSETGWGFDLTVITAGRNLEARKEVDKYIEKARQVIKDLVPDNKVTVNTFAFY